MNKVGASILVTENGSDIDIFIGEEVSYLSRLWDALKDRFIGKFIPALVTVFLASQFMAGTPIVKSAQIGFVAALVGALIDALLTASSANNWKWKESK